MNNQEFLGKVKDAFDKFLTTGSNSNEKLKILHGSIAEDLQNLLGNEYTVHSLGYGDGREISMHGRYMDKMVDIGIEKNGEIIAAIALKYIMQNYSQNSNNYFENMLGETANIRTTGKPYFQIIILPTKVPYYKDGGELKKIEEIKEHHLSKYMKLSNDDINIFYHTPNKTLLYFVDFPELPNTITTRSEYKDYYIENNDFQVCESTEPYGFGNLFIYNDYEKFIEKIYHAIMAL